MDGHCSPHLIEFATNIHPDETEYSYQHPQFVFGNEVEIKGSFSNRDRIFSLLLFYLTNQPVLRTYSTAVVTSDSVNLSIKSRQLFQLNMVYIPHII